MNVLKIAYRSLQHRTLGSLLTILSMALGVMMVVSVLTIYGLVSESFRSNSSFGYNLLVGARGGGMQLTLNSVFYLSRPIETIPYEYYLAFAPTDVRSEQMKNSIAYRVAIAEQQAKVIASQASIMPMGSSWTQLGSEVAGTALARQQIDLMKLEKRGLFSNYVDFAIPILLGDYYESPDRQSSFRVCATNSDFFSELILDVDSGKKFSFAQGRAFANTDPQVSYFGCVMGAVAARQSGTKVGDKIQVTHGVPGEENSHLHDQNFEITGILEPTGTPHDRVVFVNMEGFYLFNDHVKPVQDDSMIKITDEGDETPTLRDAADPFGEEDDEDDIFADGFGEKEMQADATDQESADQKNSEQAAGAQSSSFDNESLTEADMVRSPLPIEQRELTSILVSTRREGDPFGTRAMSLQPSIDLGDLAKTLSWSQYRPSKAQSAAQCVFPVQEVTRLFTFFVDPARWVLLVLTIMICLVSGLSILVGIYNSMSQRHHEIAVMRALGARRSHVMWIMLAESMLLALAGGAVGWVAGHGLNAALSPIVENQTGVPIRFWDIAPPERVFSVLSPLLGNSNLANRLVEFSVSPELLLIPSLILLAIAVGVYPAVSAYRTDVAKSLGK